MNPPIAPVDVRVRGICLTQSDELVVIRRTKLGAEPYRVFPGGGVEPGDASPRDALIRELDEEIAGSGAISGVVFVLARQIPSGLQEELFFLVSLETFSMSGGTGPEWTEHREGYEVELLSLQTDLNQARLLPPEAASFLEINAKRLRELPSIRNG